MHSELGTTCTQSREATESLRRLLASVAKSPLHYGSPIRKERTPDKKSNRNTFLSVQRSVVVRLAVAYRTVSIRAIFVLATLISGNLLAGKKAEQDLDGTIDFSSER